jgi:SsrA-binding protein
MRIVNKKAYFNYNILESLEAGVVLTGFEVKSIRAGRVDLSDSFARIENGEAVLKNLYVHPLQTPPQDYNPNHDRKLLLHKNQIEALTGKLTQGAYTLIPVTLYLKRNFVKVELALAQSKKKYDKRRSIKEKDEQRKLDQEFKDLS